MKIFDIYKILKNNHTNRNLVQNNRLYSLNNQQIHIILVNNFPILQIIPLFPLLQQILNQIYP